MLKTENKPVIAVDIDDVLAANAEGFANFSNKKWGTKLTADDYDEHWAQMWQVDYEEENRRREVIIEHKLFIKHRFFNEAKPVLKKLKQSYRLIIVSSRGPRIREDTVEWLTKEYGNLFEEIHFAPIWDDVTKHTLEKLKYTKADFLLELGADYLIDDQPKHCLAAVKAGIKTILFGDYKWNRHVELLPNMVRAKNGHEVSEYFNEAR